MLYAGEAFFNNGKLQWWSNGSGNYRPDPDHATQAGLPVDQFYPYDDILKGAHTRGEIPRGYSPGADHLRHTKFVGLRDDKDPARIVRET